MQISNSLLNVKRIPEHLPTYREIKDPTVVQVEDGSYMMFASIGNSEFQHWQVGRFVAKELTGEWQEIAPVIFENIAGPQLCAPAVTFEMVDGYPRWTMYIQTACFEEDGVIAVAKSIDGQLFVGQPVPVATREKTKAQEHPIIGVYDVGISEVKKGDEQLLCMVYSGYRKVGCGDIFVSYKKKDEAEWSVGERLMAQEDVPFHNRPDYDAFEWGLEGAKIIQLADDCFLMIGVCFLPKPHGHLGTRQRVFFAAASDMNGPYIPLGLPFVPTTAGENGHPDTFIDGNKLTVIYQERDGDQKPWYLRSAEFDLPKLEVFVRNLMQDRKIEMAQSQSYQDRMPAQVLSESESFDYQQYHFQYE